MQRTSIVVLCLAYGVSASILAAALIAVFSNGGGQPPETGSASRSISSDPTIFAPAEAREAAVVLTIELVKLDPGQQTARFQVGARVQPEALSPAMRLAYEGGAFDDGKAGLPVHILGYGETFEYRIQRLSEESQNDSGKVTYSAYSSGSTSRYPFDRYNATLGVIPPKGLPIALAVSKSPAWSDPYGITARDITEAFPEPTRSAEFIAVAIETKRSLATGVFALLVALSPMFLLVISWEQLRSGSRDASSVAQALPLELAAAFLALLTLRQVLVPSEIIGPTIIDGLLALELSLFVALLVRVWTVRIRTTASGSGAP